MKYIHLILCLFTSTISLAQTDSLELRAYHYFQEVKAATQRHIDLWDLNLMGPIILVDPFTRKAYASEVDSTGYLSESNGIFVGEFPKSLNISGSVVSWSGKTWAILPYMFPENSTTTDIVGYIGHELFHRCQEELGFVFPNEILNDHLNEIDGRIYLRLELNALMKAVAGYPNEASKRHLANAFVFRKYRHKIFPQASKRENLLELNEGITQYTTVKLRNRSDDKTIAKLKEVSLQFIDGPTYIRTFAYHTIPAYGFVLSKRENYWNKEISMETNLTDYFIKHLDIRIPANLDSAAWAALDDYNGEAIINEEQEREKEIIRKVKQFKENLLLKPHLEISISRNNMSFDPSKVFPIGDLGTVYEGDVRWSDKWGVLEVKNGLFLDADRSRICASAPTSIEENYARGERWQLWLNEGYKLYKKDSGNYTIFAQNETTRN